MEKVDKYNIAKNIAKKRTSVACGRLSDYEIQREEQIRQNKAVMAKLNLRNISESLSSLVDNQSGKKRKEKAKKDDPNYVPINEENNSFEVVEGASHSKKKCIAPLSLHRSLRNKKPQGMPRSASIQQNNPMKKVASRDVDSTVSKNEHGTRVQKESGCNHKLRSPSGDARIYMADFLRKINEGTNEESLPVMPSRSEAQVEFQTNDHHLGYEVQGHSFLDAWTDEEIYDGTMFDRTEDVDKDSEEDDDDMTYKHVEDGENGDDLNEEVELENDLTLDEGQEGSNSIEKEKKTRGPTMMHAVHMREERVRIILNKFGQPIGPDDKTLNEFSSFLGTVAHNYEFAPLVISTWCRMPNKHRMWEYVQKIYDVDIKGKKWVMSTIGSSWRVHKCRFKKRLCTEYADEKSRWENRPKEIHEKDFRKLLKLWKCTDYQKRCSINKGNRSLRKDNHTTGRVSYARIRAKLQSTLPSGHDIPLSTMYEVTRRRTEGREYKDSYEDTASKIDYRTPIYMVYCYEARNTDTCGGAVDGNSVVMSLGRKGSPIMCGRGVTKKDIAKAKEDEHSYSMTSNDVDTIMSTLRKEFEEENEKKTAEIEQMRKEREIEKQQMNLILAKLAAAIPNLDLTSLEV